jgi:hypothetical protein
VKPFVRKAIALMEIVGGVTGFLWVGVEVIQRRIVGVELVLGGIVAAIFLLSLFSGLLLWQDLRTGYGASIVIQLLQLPKILAVQFTFVLSFGFDAWVMLIMLPDRHGFDFRLQPGGFYYLHLARPPGAPLGLGISIVSCVTLVLLLRNKQRRSPSQTEPIAEQVENITGSGHAEATTSDRDHPEWVAPFWLKLCGVLLLALFLSCAGLIGLTR